MTWLLIKFGSSAAIIVAISELAKRSSILGAALASLPLVSVLAILWLYWETKNVSQISKFSTEVFWLVLPSLVFFLALPLALKKFSFYPSLLISLALMVACYLGCLLLYRRFYV